MQEVGLKSRRAARAAARMLLTGRTAVASLLLIIFGTALLHHGHLTSLPLRVAGDRGNSGSGLLDPRTALLLEAPGTGRSLSSSSSAASSSSSSSGRLPSSYSTLFAGERGIDAVVFLTSLALHHPNAHVYISSDSDTYEWFLEHAKVLFYRLDLHWMLALDKYNLHQKREEMEAQNTWNDFMLEKVNVLEEALKHHNDTLLLDADFVLLEPIYLPADASADHKSNYQLGVSPHYMKESECAKYGRYNGGMLWTNQFELGQVWRKFSAVSRYFEQAAIEDLAVKYTSFEFGPEHNLGFWRPVHNELGLKEFYTHFYFDDPTQSIMLRNQTIATVHTHILTTYPYDVGNDFSDIFVKMMAMSKRPVYERVSAVVRWAKNGCVPPQLAI
jgi:hypothetical protein